MAKVWKSGDGVALVLNPTLELEVEIRLRQRDEPRSRVSIESPEELELLRWLLAATDEGEGLGQRADGDGEQRKLVSEAIARGLLVPLSAIPRPEPSFRSTPDDATLALLPRGSAPVPAGAASGELRANPAVWLQAGSAIPGPIAHRVDIPAGDGRSFGAFSDDRPVWWIEDPGSDLLMPVWLDPELHDRAGKVLGGADWSTLSEDALRRLCAAQILVPARDDANAARHEDQLGQTLDDRGYLHLRDLVPPLLLASARRHFRELRREGFFELDRRQVAGMRDGLYCDVVTLFVQAQLGPLLSAVTRERLRPSYSWLRRYRPGAVLERHVDREQCRWNVSLAIDAEPELERDDAWPIWLEVDGEPVAVRLGLGDGIVYRGDEIPHWREALAEGNAATMAFLHFVRDDFTGSLD